MKTLNPVVVRVRKRPHYSLDVVLTCMRRYVSYALSLRNLEEILAGRDTAVDHSTVHRWAIRMLPLLEKAFSIENAPPATVGASTKPASRSRANENVCTAQSTRLATELIFSGLLWTGLQPGEISKSRSPGTVNPRRWRLTKGGAKLAALEAISVERETPIKIHLNNVTGQVRRCDQAARPAGARFKSFVAPATCLVESNWRT